MSIDCNETGNEMVGIEGSMSSILNGCDEAIIYCIARKGGEVVTFGTTINNMDGNRITKPFVSCIDTKQTIAAKIYEKLSNNIGQMEIGVKAISAVLETENVPT